MQFEDTEVEDWSGNSLYGTHNATEGQPGLHTGNLYSYGFNGTTQFASRSDSSLLNLGNTFTLEAFIKLDGSGSGTRTIIDKGFGAYWLLIDASNQIMLYRVGSGPVALSSISLDTNPHHIAVTKSGSTVTVYVDGIDVTGATNGAITFTDTANDFRVGQEISGGSYFKGHISDVALYPTALSAARIDAHYYQSIIYGVAASMAGTATLSAAPRLKQFPAATLSAQGSLLSTAVRRHRAASTLNGTGTITAAGLRQPLAAATLTGFATLGAIALRIQPAGATLAASGSLGGNIEVTFVGAAQLDGEGFLSAGRQLVAIPPMPIDQAPVLIPAELAPARFTEALTRGYKLCLVIQVLDGATGDVLAELDTVENGSVTLDSSAAIRGRCELSIIDDGLRDLIPFTPQDMLAPYGNEIRLGRGIRYPDGTAEAISLGVFRLRNVNPDDTGSSTTIHITGLDRWSRITDARFEETWVIPAGTNVVEAIRLTVQATYPDCPLDLGTTNFTTPQRIGERGGDRGVFIQELATSIGSELYFDGTGTLVRRPIALATDNNRWTVSEGEGGALLRVGRPWDVERIYNKVITSGEPQDGSPPVCASAEDNNPFSPTFYGGKFGQRPRFYVSQLITAQEQAALTSAGILAKSLGSSQQVTFDQMVDPTMEPGKVVRIMRERLGLDEKHVLDTLTIPLAASESMPGRTRVTEVVGT